MTKWKNSKKNKGELCVKYLLIEYYVFKSNQNNPLDNQIYLIEHVFRRYI